MGSTDRMIRLLAAAMIIFFYLNGTISATTGVILGIVAGIFILTSFIGFCPLYMPFGFSTCKKSSSR